VSRQRIAIGLVVALALACADPPRKLAQSEPVTADGLRRVPSRMLGASYVHPGADLTAYSRVRIELGEIAYERPPTRARSGRSGVGESYALTDRQRDRLERFFREAFRRELVESGRFEAATDVGPGVLDVRGRIVDLRVEVPPEPRASDRSFVRRAGELTLILDVADSHSGESLVRIADRRVISQTGDFDLYRSDSVTHAAELRKAFSRWARLLGERLDELRAQPPAA
jgi:hypothetical protein